MVVHAIAQQRNDIVTEISVKRVIHREVAEIFHDLLIADNLGNG